MKYLKLLFWRVLPFVTFICVWQFLAAHSSRIRFLFASPSLVYGSLLTNIRSGELLHDSLITLFEASSGFILGTAVGTAIGFGLLRSRIIGDISKPYLIAIGAIPVFAIAPMMIVWFGTDFQMKVAMAFFATVFTALSQAYEGGKNVAPELQTLFQAYHASPKATFWKLTLPSSAVWVFASLKLNVGSALLGAFIGEFISSEQGLGHAILRASGLYNTPGVLAALIGIIALSFLMNSIVGLVERYKSDLIEALAVPKPLRRPKSYFGPLLIWIRKLQKRK